MLAELPTALEKCSRTLHYRKGSTKILSLEDYEFITENVTSSFYVVACYLAYFRITIEAKRKILYVNESCPSMHHSLVKRAFEGDKTAFIEALELYLQEEEKKQSIQAEGDFRYKTLESLTQLLLGDVAMNLDVVDAFFRYKYQDPKNKISALKILLLNLELSFNLLEEAQGFNSFLEFLESLAKKINGLKITSFESTNDSLKFFYKNENTKEEEDEALIIKNGLFPTVFLKSIDFPKIDEALGANRRLGRAWVQKLFPVGLNNTILRLEDLLSYLEITPKENINWLSLHYRTVLDWDRMKVDRFHLFRIQYLLKKLNLPFLSFLIRCTYGDSLYSRWVIQKIATDVKSSEELVGVTLEDYLSFLGLNKYSFIKRDLSEHTFLLFYKELSRLFPEDLSELKKELCEHAPLLVPEELKLEALEHWRKKAECSKENIQKKYSSTPLNEEAKRKVKEHLHTEEVFNLLRKRALTSPRSRTRTAAALRGGLRP